MTNWVVLWFIFIVKRTVVSVDVTSLDKEVGTLQYVHMMFRHGEMSLAKKYKQDPYTEEKYWPEGMGTLTAQGILSQYHLGQWIGERYADLIPNRKYDRNAFQLYSIPKEENVMSATAVAQGIFSSTKNGLLNELKWVPVPVNKDDSFEFENCSKHEELNQRFLSSNEYHTLRRKYDDIFSSASNYTGINEREMDFNDLTELWTTFVIESNNKLALHDWAKSVYPRTLIEPVALAYILYTWTPEMKRSTGGRFFKDLLDILTNKSTGPGKLRNMTAFSMDDKNMASILDVMGIFNSVVPPFDSIIMIELRISRDNKSIVTVMYHNETTTSNEGKSERIVHLLKLPNCTEACPLEQFNYILSPFTIENWSNYCMVENVSTANLNSNNTTCKLSETTGNKLNWKQIALQTVIGIIILILVIIGLCNKMRKKSAVVNHHKTESNHADGGGTETAEIFLTSLSGTPSVFLDPMSSPPFEIFALPLPFTPPDIVGF